eukprot:TRINITY_DN10996_c0_g1_i1.p1 TRINITY_DN10996_c0_g1~~TRINITY_DN10996_c0_g1_i1.p1  ORF type:complete len:449 (+),score=177.24 TRINITY_DN10996_c0_g1_i1:170-1516(+)
MDAMAAAGGASNVPTVMVSFYTNTFDEEVNESQAFSVPKTTTKNGLSNLVNRLLKKGDDDYIPFDFLYNDEFITVGLDKFLKARPQISTDDTLALEYTPSMSMEEGNEMPHDDWVSAISAPFFGDVDDEDIVVTGCYDRRVRLCVGTETIAVGDGHKGAVKALVAMPNTRLPCRASAASSAKRRKRNVPSFTAVSAGKDCSVRVWSYSDGEGLKVARSLTQLHRESVDAVDLSPNGELVVSGGWDKQLTMFKLADCFNPAVADDQIQTATLVGHSRPVLACKFSLDSASVLSSGQDGQCKVWDVSRAAFKATYSGEYSVNAIDMHHSDPNLFLTGHSDNRARVWDIREKRSIRTFSGHLGWVYCAKWAPKGCIGNTSSNLFVTGAEDAALNLYDIRAQRPLATHDMHTDGVLGVTFTRQSTAASASKDTTVRTTTLTGYSQTVGDDEA